MNKLRVLLALTALFLASFASSAQNGSIIRDVPLDSLDHRLVNIIDAHTQSFSDTTQLAIAMVKGDQLKYIGVEKINGKLELVDNRTKVFEIGSISKVFTSTLLAHMVSKDIVKLDDRAGQILDLSDLDDYGITLQHLSNHSSGLPPLPTNLDIVSQPDNPYKAYHSDLLMEYLSGDFELTTLPGESYAYSNLGAGLLGHILTVISSRTYEQLLQEHICIPYGLNSTTTQRLAVDQGLLVAGRQPNGTVASNWDFDVLVGAGGILSTVEDLVLFARSQIQADQNAHHITHKKTLELSDHMDIGLGWHIIKPQGGGKWLWHNGGTAGYTSSMTIDKQQQTAVLILSNVSAFHSEMSSIDELCWKLLTELNN